MSKFTFKKSYDVQLNVRVDTETDTQIQAISTAEGVDRTEVVRQLIKVGLEEYVKEKDL